MGEKFRQWCPAEAWRLLWLMGTMFAVIMMFQHFELPYGDILSSSSSARKNPGAGNTSLLKNGAESDLGMDHVNISSKSSSTQETEGRSSPENVTSTSGNSGTLASGIASIVTALPHNDSPPNLTVARNVEYNIVTQDPDIAASSLSKSGELQDNMTEFPALQRRDPQPNITFTSNGGSNFVTQYASADPKTAASNLSNDGESTELPISVPALSDSSPGTSVPEVQKMPEKPISEVLSISEMNSLLLRSLSYSNSVRLRWPSAADQELLKAKSLIKNAPVVKNDPILYAPVYHNLSIFKRSYELMEDTLKVYIYKEGEKPIFHQPSLTGIYASEGWFMKLMEANRKFVTKDPRKAHLFYLPFSSRMLEEKLYVTNSHSFDNLIQFLKNYLDLIVAKYPFWNRTAGADHFLVACHDWAPFETRQLMANCMRALCNNDVKEGFVFGKDASLPETIVSTPRNPLRDLGGKPPQQRSILAFFAGSMHGYVRSILLQHWQNKDPDMKIFARLPKVRRRRKGKGKGEMNYAQYMKSSKYCICAKGYEVNSPRVVEAIFYECVPVILSDNFVPPFFEVLNWESFAVFVMEKDIPNLKNILTAIPEKRYLEMQRMVKQVQKHFLWHATPEKYDIFHMILHSIWYNKVFQTLDSWKRF